MGLVAYKAKRNFAVTAEPSGKPLPKRLPGASRFVIQKHDASRLHYDFRLEMDGVLKSWAVPKGLPWAQGEKHLAVEVEDHPLEYENFEGVIPAGNYGGGTVMVWDKGTYYVYGEEPLKSLHAGKLHLVLEGEKAKGEWTLVRIRGRDENNQWLLLISGRSHRPLGKKRDDQSVKTGRTMKAIAADRDAEWDSKKGEQKVRRAKARTSVEIPAGLPMLQAKFLSPMKPKLVADPPPVGDWIYELKWDGIRLLALKNGDHVSLLSRNENELAGRFAAVADAVRELPCRACVLDGEVVALDAEGRSSFQLLQAPGESSPAYYYLFDLLQLDGKSALGLPVVRRKELLAELSRGAGDPIRFSSAIEGDPATLLREVKRRGLEGIIGKRAESIYEPGRRSGAWIKLKCVAEQEFVIGGYTPPGGTRPHFGAVIVGYYEKKRLLFAGKVGTGFNTKLLGSLQAKFQAEARDDSPFADLPSKHAGQWAQGITPAMMKKCHWINPVLVAQVKFSEWTRDGKLRQPVFLGLREDKRPLEVTRERAA